MDGVIDSSTALHYGGFPTVQMAFEADPMTEGRCVVDSADGIDGDCVTFMTGFTSDVWTGARSPLVDTACPAQSEQGQSPWLLEDFLGDAVDDGNGGQQKQAAKNGA